jgi:hypothetical protein
MTIFWNKQWINALSHGWNTMGCKKLIMELMLRMRARFNLTIVYATQ